MIIQLPFVPAYEDQMRAVVGILSELPSYVQPGVQIFRGPVDLYDQIDDSELAYRVRTIVPHGFVKILHAPIADNTPDKKFNLTYPESDEYVLRNARLAEEIGARSLTIHTNTVFYSTGEGEFAWTPDLDEYGTMVQRVRDPVFGRLDKLAKQTGVVIGVENMPLPIRGDKILDPAKILYEPNMNTYEDLSDFCQRTTGTPNLQITYDTSHGEITRRVVNRLIGEGVRTTDDLQRTPFRGIYPGHFGVQPDVKDVLFGLLEKGKVADVQLSDTRGLWIPYGSLIEEGVVLGDGFLGEDIFEIVRRINKHYDGVPVSIDVGEKDRAGYLQRPRQRESLGRLLAALK